MITYRRNRAFEWDPAKASHNADKHGVSFEEASTAFDDVDGLDGEDVRHSLIERRRLRLARSHRGRIVVVAYTAREETVRIISARRASRKERLAYAKVAQTGPQ